MEFAAFIKQNGLEPGQAEFDAWKREFSAELLRGLRGEKSSLRMIPTYLDALSLPPGGESVIVLDAGGTNLRAALMEFTPEGPKPSFFETIPMLGTQGRLTAEEFYDGLAALIAPIAERSRRIGFCFSFPCEILPNLDGKILHFDKEVDIVGAEGSLLGDGLRRALCSRGLRHDHAVAVINDTVAAMLGAQAQLGSGSTYMGFILGTGTNLCASFPNEMITKAPMLAGRKGSTIINLESGGFDRFTRSSVELAFDASTANPGDQCLEKLISGAYQGPMVLAYLKAAAGEGLFSPAAWERIGALDQLTAKDVSQFILEPQGDSPLAGILQDTADRERAGALLDAFFHRAALLTAATLAAVLDRSGSASCPDAPVRISAEGTTFYRCPLLHRYILQDMDTFVTKGCGLYSTFVQAEAPNLTGTALAALSL